jgi:hypothetical protein
MHFLQALGQDCGYGFEEVTGVSTSSMPERDKPQRLLQQRKRICCGNVPSQYSQESAKPGFRPSSDQLQGQGCLPRGKPLCIVDSVASTSLVQSQRL